MRALTARLLSGCEVYLYAPPMLWGRVVQPEFALTDGIASLGAWTQGVESPQTEDPVYTDPLLGYAMLPLGDVLSDFSNAFRAASSSPSVSWEHSVDGAVTPVSDPVPGVGDVWEFTAGGQVYQHYYEPLEPTPNRVLMVEIAKGVASPSARRWALAPSVSCQAARFRWYIEPVAAENAQGSVIIAVAVVDWDATYGQDSELEWYGLEFKEGLRPRVVFTRASLNAMRETSGSSVVWREVKDVLGESGTEYQNSVHAYREEPRSEPVLQLAEVFASPTRLCWRLNGASNGILVPYEVPSGGADNEPSEDRYIAAIPPYRRIVAFYALWSQFRQFRFNAGPVYFVPTAKWQSNEHTIGFQPVSPPSFEVRHASKDPVPGTTTTATLQSDPDADRLALYELVLQAPSSLSWQGRDYAEKTPLVQAVTVRYTGVWDSFVGEVVRGYPSAVQIVQQFDLSRLQIVSRAELVWQDITGDAAQRFLNRGLEAVTIHGTRYAQSDDGSLVPDDTRVGTPLFTGYANWNTAVTTQSGGHLDTRVSCVDRSVQLQQPYWWLPWFDGWNVYYAMAYLAQLGGIRPEFIGFLDKVPSDPYGEVAGSNAWFMPVGSAGTPLTRFSGVPLWDIMTRIAHSIGYMLYFDVNGVLQFHKYRIPTGYRYLIVEDDVGYDAGYTLPAWGISYNRSMAAVRNEMMVIGIDAYAPLWLPIVSRRTDESSLSDPTAFNYLGFRSRTVWADSQFANTEFARRAADAMYQFLRAPHETLSLSTYFTPDLYAGDVVAAYLPRIGIDTIERYLVVGVSHALGQGSVGQTHLQLRWLPAALVEPETPQ